MVSRLGLLFTNFGAVATYYRELLTKSQLLFICETRVQLKHENQQIYKKSGFAPTSKVLTCIKFPHSNQGVRYISKKPIMESLESLIYDRKFFGEDLQNTLT